MRTADVDARKTHIATAAPVTAFALGKLHSTSSDSRQQVSAGGMADGFADVFANMLLASVNLAPGPIAETARTSRDADEETDKGVVDADRDSVQSPSEQLSASGSVDERSHASHSKQAGLVTLEESCSGGDPTETTNPVHAANGANVWEAGSRSTQRETGTAPTDRVNQLGGESLPQHRTPGETNLTSAVAGRIEGNANHHGDSLGSTVAQPKSSSTDQPGDSAHDSSGQRGKPWKNLLRVGSNAEQANAESDSHRWSSVPNSRDAANPHSVHAVAHAESSAAMPDVSSSLTSAIVSSSAHQAATIASAIASSAPVSAAAPRPINEVPVSRLNGLGQSLSSDVKQVTATESQTAGNAPRSDRAASEMVARVKLVQRVSRAFQHLGPDGGSIRLRLAPAELGTVRIEMQVSDRKVRARVVAESEAARDTLREHLADLRARLESYGMHVERLEVETEGRQRGSGFGADADSGGQSPHHHAPSRGGSAGSNQSSSPVAEETPSAIDPESMTASLPRQGVDVRL